jgi:hypothetical protein
MRFLQQKEKYRIACRQEFNGCEPAVQYFFFPLAPGVCVDLE